MERTEHFTRPSGVMMEFNLMLKIACKSSKTEVMRAKKKYYNIENSVRRGDREAREEVKEAGKERGRAG